MRSLQALDSLQEPGWTQLGGDSNDALVAAGLDRVAINRQARWYYYNDPMLNHAVRLHSSYTFARGVSVKAREPSIQRAVVEPFWRDQRNRHTLTRAAAQWTLNRDRKLDGELFLAFYVSTLTGRVTVRTIDPSEITQVVSAPGDPTWPIYYRREYSPQAFDFSRGGYTRGARRVEYLPDFRNAAAEPAAGGHGSIVSWPTNTEIYVMHICTNALGGRGLSHLATALPWVKALKGFMEDRATLTLALATFAFRQKVRGSRQALARVAAQWGSYETAMRYGGDGRERRQGANTFIENENSTLEQLKTDSGASNAYTDARMLKQMAGIGADGIFEHYFGDPSCYSEDTEVLTEDGWLRHGDWNGQRVACYNPDTENYEWHYPLELHTYTYQGQMVHFQNAQTDILVTPNHRMWTAPHVQWKRLPALAGESQGRAGRPRVADGGRPLLDRSWRIEEARTLRDNPRAHGWRFKTAASFEGEAMDSIHTPVGIKNACAWARFMGHWLAEGSTLGPTKRNGEPRQRVYYRVMLGHKPGDNLDDMQAVLDALDLHYTSAVNPASGVVTLTVACKPLWEYLRQNAGTCSSDKRVPRELLNAGHDVRLALFETMMAGDGGVSGRSLRYSSSSKQLADDMQVLALSLGYGASVTLEYHNWNNKPHPIWRVWIRSQWLETKIKPHHVTAEDYDGVVYCFHVPHTIYITRRNGKIAVQGNTGNLATATAMELPMLKMFEFEQELWQSAFEDILWFVLVQHLRFAPPRSEVVGQAQVQVDLSGGTPLWVLEPVGDMDLSIDVTLPPIVQSDVAVWSSALAQIAQAQNLTGQQIVPPEQMALKALQLLGFDDAGRIIDDMKKGGFKLADNAAAFGAALGEALQRKLREADAKDVPDVGEPLPEDEAKRVDPITKDELDRVFERLLAMPELDELLDEMGLTLDDVDD